MINRVVWANNGWEKVVAHYDRILSLMPYAQAGVMVEDDRIILISYTTPVIFLWVDKRGHRCMDCSGTYSATTRKHIGAFLREYCPEVCYYDAKRAFKAQGTFDIDERVIYPYPHE